MFTLVTGTGYTGRRVLSRLPADSAVGLSRSMIESVRPAKPFDLDTATALPVPLPSRYCVIYTVPPKGPPPDRRLQRFLPMLERHAEHYGSMALQVAVDGSYASVENLDLAKKAGVEDVAFHKKRGLAVEDIDLAKYKIDLLAMLQGKTEGNLTHDEKQQLEEVLYQLRMIYVQKSGAIKS